MNTLDYRKKMKILLDKAYMGKKILIEKSNISSKIKSTLKFTNPLSQRLYGLSKIHKYLRSISHQTQYLRSIVSAINTPTYKLLHFLAQDTIPHRKIWNTHHQWTSYKKSKRSDCTLQIYWWVL